MDKEVDPKKDTGYWHELYKNVDYRSEGYYIVKPKKPWDCFVVRRKGNLVCGFTDLEGAEFNARYHAGNRKYKRGEIKDDLALLDKHYKRLNGVERDKSMRLEIEFVPGEDGGISVLLSTMVGQTRTDIVRKLLGFDGLDDETQNVCEDIASRIKHHDADRILGYYEIVNANYGIIRVRLDGLQAA